MQYNLKVGRGRWYFWLAVVECSWMADTIYLFISYEYYIQSGSSIYPMYLSTFPLKSAVWQDLPCACMHVPLISAIRNILADA
jgi:hypothetical protein